MSPRGSAPRRSRLEWEELRTYWEEHADHDGQLDLARDPDALGNVVWPGQPLWLNEHMADLQTPVYEGLLDQVAIGDGERALDVGCGSGRWTQRLAARGFDVTGIDLQAQLIAYDRRRFPAQHFEQVALQDFHSDDLFNLVSSVTVLQHNPHDHHPVLAAKLRSLLAPGGHALILENVHDQASHVFARPVEGWREVFEAEGFTLLASRPYDWSPSLRMVLAARRLGPAARVRHGQGNDRGPGPEAVGGLAAAVKGTSMRVAAAVDRPLERLLTRARWPGGSVHCGLLFRAR